MSVDIDIFKNTPKLFRVLCRVCEDDSKLGLIVRALDGQEVRLNSDLEIIVGSIVKQHKNTRRAKK